MRICDNHVKYMCVNRFLLQNSKVLSQDSVSIVLLIILLQFEFSYLDSKCIITNKFSLVVLYLVSLAHR